MTRGHPQLGLPQELLDMVEVQEKPLRILGVGPDYTRLPKIQKGMVWEKPRNCLPSEEKVGLSPPHHSLNFEKPKLPKVQ